MTVKELMEILATMPEDAIACGWDPEYPGCVIEDVRLSDDNEVIIS